MRPLVAIILILGLGCCALLAPANAQEKVVSVYGWGDYIDPKVIEDFTKETGIKVTYDAYNSRAVIDQQALGGTTGFDVIIVPGRDLEKLIAAGKLQRLDKTKLPNSANLWPEVMARLGTYDPGNQYAVNYLWFTMGLAYNIDEMTEVVGDVAAVAQGDSAKAPLISWNILLQIDNLKKFASCGVGIVDSPEDVFAIASQYLRSDWGVAPEGNRQTDFTRAAKLLNIILRNAKKFDSAGFVDALANGDICLAAGYSLDTYRARARAREADNGIDIDYIIPKEGGLMLLDNLAIPKDSPHLNEAYAFIDFLLRPEVAAQNTNFTHLANSVLSSKSGIAKVIAENTSIYPSEAMMRRLVATPNYFPSQQKFIQSEWAEKKMGGQPR
jgi:putrescine transport system substrate-binding protein